MTTVAIVDHGLCNLDSIRRAVEECGGRPLVTASSADVEAADRIVLPGVGSFYDAMRRLRAAGLDDALRNAARRDKKPLLGICLGMQLLATTGEEGGAGEGLGLVPAKVLRMVAAEKSERVPHVGWNEVKARREHSLFADIPEASDFYFVHGYRVCCHNEGDELATTPYCGGFTSAIASGNVMGVQFHPEKSQKMGFQLLRNFLAC